MKALVVDDEPAMRGVCSRLLEEMGFLVETASSREDAWHSLAGAPFDLVLTDLQMGTSTDGVALTEEIKSRSPGTEVVIMTGKPELETAVTGLKSGASDYIGKPFEPAHLRSVVAHCLERRRLRGELDREKGLKQELESAYVELQKVERLKDAFLARINHELRTPVTVALMAAQVIEPQLGDEPGRALWSKLNRSIMDLKSVVEELVLFSKLARRDAELSRGPVDLWALVEELAREHEALCRDRDLKLELVLKGPLKTATADREMMRTALRHLLLNAIRFNKNGGRIVVEGEFSDARAKLSFVDSGIGVPGEEVRHLFDSFYQVAEHLTREVGGLGLGLATVRRIVEAHGGAVSVESRVERGSIFTISIPL